MAETGNGGCSASEFAAVQYLIRRPGLAADFCRNASTAITADQAVLRLLVEQQAVTQRLLSDALSTVFLLFSGCLVFLMQAGFALLCVGNTRLKSSRSVLAKNIIDCCVGTVAFFLVGYSFAYGDGPGSNPFMGAGNWAMSEATSDPTDPASWVAWFFKWAFCSTAATIVAGAVAERINFPAYIGATLLMSGWVFPVCAHWVWARNGWLSVRSPNPLFGAGAIDFAGGGPIHIIGGVAAFAGAACVGPRLGRFAQNSRENEFRTVDANSMALGTLLLWVGWYGFNAGSVGSMNSVGHAATAGRAAVATTLAAGAGGVTLIFLNWSRQRVWSVGHLCNGVLSGLVTITAGCGVMPPWVGYIAGVLGALLFCCADYGVQRLQVDDPVAAGPMHAACGVLGVLLVGFFATPEYVDQVYRRSGPAVAGVVWGGDGRLLAAQLVQAAVMAAWSGVMMGGYFCVCRVGRVIRVPPELEVAGLDASKYSLLTTNSLPSIIAHPAARPLPHQQRVPTAAPPPPPYASPRPHAAEVAMAWSPATSAVPRASAHA